MRRWYSRRSDLFQFSLFIWALAISLAVVALAHPSQW